MLSVTKAYEDFRLIRVLVVPLGVNSQFEDQFRILSRLESIPLYDLNKPLYLKGYNPPFKYLDWLKGELCFDFLRYDQAPSGPTDFEDFQSSKRIVIIMGVLNYPDFINHSEKLEVELDRFAKRYPNILLKRIMVFNYNFDSSSTLKMQAAPGLLEIFPPDGDCEGGSMLDVHFRQVMAQTSVQLVQAFEQQMDHCEDARLRGIFPNNPSLTTGFDDKDDTRSGSSKNSKVFRKRPIGRIHKWMGDLSLQVCSPLDAIEHYVIAISESRSQGDSLWLAGALDGYASAILLLQELQFDLEETIGKDLRTVTQPGPWNSDDDDDEYYEEEGDDGENGPGQSKYHVPEVFLLAEERAAEALNFYASHVAFKNMELESCFRMAKLYESRMLKHSHRLQKLSEYIMRAVAIPGLSARQQLDAVLEAALVCRRAGLFRKQTKLLYIAALMAADQGHYAIASVLMEQVAEHFGVSVGSLAAQDDNAAGNSHSDNASSEEITSRDLRNGWLDLSISVLSDAAAIAQEAQSPQFTAQVLCRLLSLQSAKEFEHATIRSFLSQYTRKSLGLEKFVRKKVNTRGYANDAAVMALQSQHIPETISQTSVPGNEGGLPVPPRAPPSISLPPSSTTGIASIQPMKSSGAHSPTPSDKRSVSSVLTTNTYRGGLRQASFNPLTGSGTFSTAEREAMSASMYSHSDGVNNGVPGNSSSLPSTGTDTFLASLRSLTVPKLQLGIMSSSASGGDHSSMTLTTTGGTPHSPGRNSRPTNGSHTVPSNSSALNPKSPDYKQLTRATQAQVASSGNGRTLSGAHTNSISQKLLRSLAGDLLALDSASSSSFNLFDANFGLTATTATVIGSASDANSNGGSNHVLPTLSTAGGANASSLTASLAAAASGNASSLTTSSNILISGNNVTTSSSVTLSNPSSLSSNSVGVSNNTNIGGGNVSISLPDTTLFHLVDISIARDILHYVTARLVSQHIALDVQEAVWSNLLDATACLARPVRSLSHFSMPSHLSVMTKHRIQMPITLLSLRPTRPWDKVIRQYSASIVHRHSAPASLSASLRTLLTEEEAKQAQLHANDGDTAADVTDVTGSGSNKQTSSSAFFYDPFAARRQQQQKAAAQSLEEVTWSYDSDDHSHSLVATLTNPLSVAVSLRLVCLLKLTPFTGNTVENSENEEAELTSVLTVYPVEVEVPPRTLQYEVRIPVDLDTLLRQQRTQSSTVEENVDSVASRQEKKMWTLKVVGMRMVLGGLSELVTVDTKGNGDLSGRSWALQRLVKRQLLTPAITNPATNNEKKGKAALLSQPQRNTAKTNEIKVVSSPGQLMFSDQLPSQMQTRMKTDTEKIVSLFPGEIRQFRYYVTVVDTNTDAMDIRIRLMHRHYHSSSKSNSTLDPLASATTVCDFSLLSNANNSKDNSSLNLTTNSPHPLISVSLEAMKTSSCSTETFVVNICMQDTSPFITSATGNMKNASSSSNQDTYVDILVDVVPLTKLQHQALQMLRGLIPPEIAPLTAITTTEESKKWSELPMVQGVLNLHIRRYGASQSLSWKGAMLCAPSLPPSEAGALARVVYDRVSPLRTNANLLINNDNMVVGTTAVSNNLLLLSPRSPAVPSQTPSDVGVTSPRVLQVPPLALQPHHIEVKLLHNTVSCEEEEHWQSCVSNQSVYPVDVSLVTPITSPITSMQTYLMSLVDNEDNVEKIFQDSVDKGRFVIAPGSAINMSFTNEDIVSECSANIDKNSGNDGTDDRKMVLLRWSFKDEVEHGTRRGLLTLTLPHPRTSSCNSNGTTKEKEKSHVSATWLNMEVSAKLKSSQPQQQPIKLLFSKAQSLLTPTLHPLDILCTLRIPLAFPSSVEILVLLEEEYASLFPKSSQSLNDLDPAQCVATDSTLVQHSGSFSQSMSLTSNALPVHAVGSHNNAIIHNDASNAVTLTGGNAHGVAGVAGRGVGGAPPAGVFVTGKLRTVCPLSTLSTETQQDRACHHSLRICFMRHGLFTLRYLVRALPERWDNGHRDDGANKDNHETWWTTKHPIVVRVCLNE